jgi:hypothetical protein
MAPLNTSQFTPLNTQSKTPHRNLNPIDKRISIYFNKYLFRLWQVVRNSPEFATRKCWLWHFCNGRRLPPRGYCGCPYFDAHPRSCLRPQPTHFSEVSLFVCLCFHCLQLQIHLTDKMLESSREKVTNWQITRFCRHCERVF